MKEKRIDALYNNLYKTNGRNLNFYKKLAKLLDRKEKSIHNRPREIDEKEEFGHWELDCVEGSKDSKKTYMTLLERLTKKYIVIEMEAHTNKCVKHAIDSLEEKYKENFSKIFKSMTTGYFIMPCFLYEKMVK